MMHFSHSKQQKGVNFVTDSPNPPAATVTFSSSCKSLGRLVPTVSWDTPSQRAWRWLISLESSVFP